MRRAWSDGEPDTVVALPHPQSVLSMVDEKHTVLSCDVRSAKDADWGDEMTTAGGEKADAAAAKRAPPTMRWFLMVVAGRTNNENSVGGFADWSSEEQKSALRLRCVGIHSKHHASATPPPLFLLACQRVSYFSSLQKWTSRGTTTSNLSKWSLLGL